MRANIRTKVILITFYLCFVIIPLFGIFSKLNLNLLYNILLDKKKFLILINSISIAMISTLIVLFLSYIAAFIMERTKIKYKSIFRLIFIVTMLVPSFSSSIGLIVLFGNNGIITNFFNINIRIYGMKGIVLGEILYAFPVAFLMFDDILKYENPSAYQEASVLGISRYNIFKGITLPYIKKPLISIMFCVFTLIITDYGIPLIIGGKCITLPLLIYQEVLGRLDFDCGICYSTILLAIALVSFLFDIYNRNYNMNNKTRKFILSEKNIILYYLYYIILSICILLPIFSYFALIDIESIYILLHAKFIKYLSNSLLSAISSSLIGTFVAFISAYISITNNKVSNMLIQIFAIISLAVPGLVLGLSYVLLFNGTFFYDTLIIIIIVNIVHFISTPYIMAYNSLSKLNINIRYQATIFGISSFNFLKDVIVPLNIHTILEMFSFYFVNCMMTISAVSFLSTNNTRPISLLINQFQEQMQIGASALTVTLILLVNLAVKILFERLGSKKNGIISSY